MMAGGGGGRGLDPRELRFLQEKAKNRLEESARGTKCNVFISFVAEDLNDVNLLRGQAKNDNSDIEFNDWSVKEPFDSKEAEYVRRKIRERIRQCSVTVVYVSNETAGSRWVDWEIRETLAMGKGVVAMYKGDKQPTVLPKAILDNRVRVVPWNQRALAEAIQSQAKNT